jgi:hypothetical protein
MRAVKVDLLDRKMISIVHVAEHFALSQSPSPDGVDFFRRYLSEDELQLALRMAAQMQIRLCFKELQRMHWS